MPRDENRVADAVGRAAREADARVVWRGDATDALVARFFKPSSKPAPVAESVAVATGDDEVVEVEQPSLSLVPVRVKRRRGRPARREARRLRPPADVLSATCRCLRCDKEVKAGEVAEALPVFC